MPGGDFHPSDHARSQSYPPPSLPRWSQGLCTTLADHSTPAPTDLVSVEPRFVHYPGRTHPVEASAGEGGGIEASSP